MNKAVATIFTTLVITSPLALLAEESVQTEIQTKAPFTSFTGRVTGNKVRLRTQPSLEGHVLRETKLGEMVGIIGEKEDFYAVAPSYDSKGYVFRTFILDGVVEGENINIRLHPDADAPVIGKLSRGERVECQVSSLNNKWLEISLPASVPFYIAKEYVEKCGPFEMLAELEKRKHEATCHLNSAYHFAQSEIQKPFPEIDLDTMLLKFAALSTKFNEFPEIMQRSKELSTEIQEQFLQKKIAFLESKTGSGSKVVSLPQIVKDVVEASVSTASEKMALWQPVEESLYHLWMAHHEDESMEQFYAQEEQNANILTGVVEVYSKPVKNRPGDYLLKDNHLPVAFLYSTQVDLEGKVGQKVTLKAAPRPNNNFAFPAYFVLSVE